MGADHTSAHATIACVYLQYPIQLWIKRGLTALSSGAPCIYVSVFAKEPIWGQCEHIGTGQNWRETANLRNRATVSGRPLSFGQV